MLRPLPGIGVAAIAVAVGFGVHALLPIVPTLTVAFVLGLAFGQLPMARRESLTPGFAFSARKLLRLGVVLLGLKVSVVDVLQLGWLVFLLIVLLVGVAFGLTYLVFRLLRVDRARSLLVAAGFSICGVSAIGATAAAVRTNDEDSKLPIALVTLFGTAAIAVLPLANGLLHLGDHQFGAWVGASVHDVGQVVATASTAGTAALAIAITIKLVRVILLAPMVAIAGVVARGRSTEPGKRPPIVPLFVVGFIVVAILGNLLPLQSWGLGWVLVAADLIQTILFGLALFSIGAGIRLRTLFTTDGRAVLAGAVSWVLIAAAALLVVLLAVAP